MPVRPAHALLLLIALGLAARCWNGRIFESLWYDEIAAWRDYGVQHATDIVSTWHDPANHVFHTLLTHFSVAVVPGALGPELGLRLPALLFSLASIATIAALGRAAGSVRTGWCAGLLAAINPVSVLSGCEARGYSMMIFFASLSTLLMMRLCRPDGGTPPRTTWLVAGYALASALGVWTHLVSAFVPAGHALWLVFSLPARERRPAARRGALAIALSAVLSLLFLSPILGEITAARSAFRATSADQPSLLGTEGLHALFQLGGSWYAWAAWPGLALGAIGAAALARERRARGVVCLALLGLPVFVAAIALSGAWMYARFTLFAFPGAALLIALGAEQLWSWRRWAGAGALAVVALFSLADLTVRPPKQPLRDAADWVREQTRANAAARNSLLVVDLRAQALDVYAADLAPTYSLFHGRDLDEKLASEPRWVIVLYPQSVPEDRLHLLDEHGYRLARRFEGWVDWTNGDVLVYERSATPDP